MTSPSVVQKLAKAIAQAEGFFVESSRPKRNHNPGDLTRDLTGKGVGFDAIYVIYGNDEDGWEALRRQVSLMFHGSHIYNPSMTIAEVSRHYTTTDQNAWATIVSEVLGVTVDTRLADIKP